MSIIECGECHRLELSVDLMEQHFREKHGTQLEKVCVHYGLGFDVPFTFYDPLVKKHELPPPIDANRESQNQFHQPLMVL